MMGGNVAHTATAHSTLPVAQPQVKWTAQLGGSLQSTPAMAPGDTAAIIGTDDGRLVWLDMTSGAVLRTMRASAGIAFSATPLVAADGTVYAANEDGRLYCRQADGAEWHVPANSAWGPLLASPVFLDMGGVEYVLVASTDGHLYLVNPATRSVTDWFTAGGGIESTPVIVGSTVAATAPASAPITTGDASVTVALADLAKFAVGDELFVDGNPLGFITAIDSATGVITVSGTSPADYPVGTNVTSVPHRTAYFGCTDGHVYAVNADAPAPTTARWVYPSTGQRVEGFTAAPVVVGNRLFIGDRAGKFYAFDLYSGTLVNDPSVHPAQITGEYTAAALAGGNTLYAGIGGDGLARIDVANPNNITWVSDVIVPTAVPAQPVGDASGSVLVGGRDGALYCINNAGALAWTWPATPRGPALLGSAIVANNVSEIVLTTADGHVFCLDAAGVAPVPAPGRTAAGPWPQFQRNSTHNGVAGSAADEFAAIPSLTSTATTYFAPNKLRWSLNTTGSVVSSAAVVRTTDTVRKTVLTAAMAIGDTTLSVFSTDDLCVGEILIVGADYLGPIREIDTTAKSVTITYPATQAHAVNDEVQVSLYRRDTLVGARDALDGAVLAGAIQITVKHGGWFTPGMRVRLSDRTSPGTQTEVVSITNVAGNVLTVESEATTTQQLKYSYGDNSYVFANVDDTPSRLHVDHYERFLVGDRVAIGDEKVHITAINGAAIDITPSLEGEYANATVLWVGEPGRWAGYIGSDDGILRSFDPDTGVTFWTNSVASALGPVRGTPVMDTRLGRLYVTSLSGRVLAFAQHGQLLWAYPDITAEGLSPISGSPVLDEAGNVYFATQGGYIYKLLPDGSLARKSTDPTVVCIYPQSPDPALAPIEGGLALYQPTTTLQRVVFGTRDGKLLILDSDLNRVWTYPDDITVNTPTVGAITAAPVIGPDGTIYISDHTGKVHAIYEVLNPTPPPAILQITSRWIDDGTGAPYQFQADGAVTAAAAVANGVLYVGDDTGRIYAVTGTTKSVIEANIKSLPLDGGVTGSLTLDAAGNLLVGTARGNVCCLGNVDEWGAPKRYGAGSSTAAAGATLGTPWEDATTTYDPNTQTVTLVGRIKPTFTQDDGSPLIAYRAVWGGQAALFGFRKADLPVNPASPGYIYVALNDAGQMAIAQGVNTVAAVPLPVDTLPQYGVDVILTVTALGGGAARATAYYRAPDDAGNFVGAFTPIGTVVLPTGVGDDLVLPTQLYPFVLATDFVNPAPGFSVTVDPITLYQGNPPSSWSNPQGYGTATSTVAAGASLGEVWSDMSQAYDPNTQTITLQGKIVPQFTDDVGNPLTAYHAFWHGQSALLGLGTGSPIDPNTPGYVYAALNDAGQVAIACGVSKVTAISLPAGKNPAFGVEIKLTIEPTTPGKARATAYYRAPDAGGTFSGNFVQIGQYDLPTMEGLDTTLPTALYPFMQARDAVPPQPGFTARVEQVTVSADATLIEGMVSNSPGIRWVWNAHRHGGSPAMLPFRTAPTTWMGGLVIAGCDNGTIYAIGPKGSAWDDVAQPGDKVPQTAGSWPFFHRDARRQGSMQQAAMGEVGALQPSLRWFKSHDKRLLSSPVISSYTANHTPIVWQGSDDGYLYGRDASTGELITQYPTADNEPIAPIRATPAVHTGGGSDTLGSVAVAGMGGRLYLLDHNATMLADTGSATTGLGKLLGSFYASPVVRQDRDGAQEAVTVYAATVDSLHTTGNYTFTSGAGTNTAMTDGNTTTQATGDNALKINYQMPHTALVTRVRIRTANAGELWCHRGTDASLVGVYDGNTAPRYLHVDLNRYADRVEWRNLSTDGTIAVQAMEVYTAGAEQAAPPAVTYRDGDDPAEPALTPPFSYTGRVLIAELDTQPTYVYRATITTQDAGILRVVGANGQQYDWWKFTSKTAPEPVDIVIDRYVTRLVWEVTEAVPTARTAGDFQLSEKDLASGGGRVYAFQFKQNAGVWTTTLLWQYPVAGDPALAPISSSPAVVTGAERANDILYVATEGGQMLALSGDGAKLAEAQLFNKVLASPVLVDTVSGASVFVADMGGVAHLFDANLHEMSGWPAPLAGACPNAAALTAERQAVLTTDNGVVYYINLGARDYGTNTAPVSAGQPMGAAWPPQAPTYDADPSENTLALIGRIKPNFTLDDGTPLTAYRTTWGGQNLLFGFRKRDDGTASPASPGYVYAFVNDIGQLGIGSGMSTATVGKLPAGSRPDLGLELALVLRPISASSAAATVYYRLPNADGNYAGVFTQAGSLSLPTGAAGNTELPTGVYPFMLGTDMAPAQPGYTPAGEQITLYTGSNTTLPRDGAIVGPLVTGLEQVPTNVYSSPVIDSLGRVFVGSEAGELYCLKADGEWTADASIVQWRYRPDRSTVATALHSDVDPGTSNLPVVSTEGFRSGDVVQITRRDGSLPEDLGTVLSVVPPPDPIGTKLTVAAPEADPTIIHVASTAGMAVGATVSILALYDITDPTHIPQPLRVVGKIVRVVDATTLQLDTAVEHIKLDTVLPDTDQYAVNSLVFVSQGYGYITVSKKTSTQRLAGDMLRVVRGNALPMRTSPSIGPASTVYVGASDGILYAVGPVGPAGFPEPIPTEQGKQTVSIWWTFHHDNQRTGFAERPAAPTKDLRWYRDTGSTLESSPAIGYADDTATMGILYVGTSDEPDKRGFPQQRGSLMAWDASDGRLFWRFDDGGNMGKVLTSPAVFVHEYSDQYAQEQRDEIVVFGTMEMPVSVRDGLLAVELASGLVKDHIAVGDEVVAIQVVDASRFRADLEVFITDAATSANFESYGIIAAIDGDWLVLSRSRVAVRAHAFGSAVRTQTSQQGRVYAVDRFGQLRWKFPAEGATASERIGPVRSSPVIDMDGNTYFGTDDGVIYALDSEGSLKWSYFVPRVSSAESTMQVVSPPTLDITGKRLFIGISVPPDGSEPLPAGQNVGYLLALDTLTSDSSRRLLWKVQLDGPITAAPLFTSVNGYERLFVGSDDLYPTDGLTGVFYYIDAADGTVIDWINNIGPITGTAAAIPETNTAVFTRPDANWIDATRTVVTLASNDGLLAGHRVLFRAQNGAEVESVIREVNADGQHITLETALPDNIYLHMRTNEHTVFVGDLTGKLYALAIDLNTDKFWRDATNTIVPLGMWNVGGPIRTSPAISLEENYLNSGKRAYGVYFGSNDRFIYALRAFPIVQLGVAGQEATLAYRWEKNVRDRVYGSPVIGLKTADADFSKAIVYQVSRDQYIYAFGDQVGYEGDPVDPDGPDDDYVPPDDDPANAFIPSNIAVDKTISIAENDPTSGAPNADKSWLKLVVTVKNVGRGVVKKVSVVDSLPENLVLAAPPYYDPASLKIDEQIAVSPAAPWEITYSSKDADGFVLLPNIGDPTQPISQHTRSFTFYIKVAPSGRGYVDGETFFRVSNNAAVYTNPALNDPSWNAVKTRVGDRIYLQLRKHPMPLGEDVSAGQNHLLADAETYEGSLDRPLPIQTRKDTSLQNDWTDVFKVRLYYNGRRDPVTGRLSQDGEDLRTFSPWNQIDVRTGRPLMFKVETPEMRGNGGQITGGWEMKTYAMVKSDPQYADGYGVSGVRYRLLPSAVKRFDRSGLPDGVVDSAITPYGWRVTIQQGRMQINKEIAEWGPELGVEERVKVAQITSAAGSIPAGGTRSFTFAVEPSSAPQRLKADQIVVIINPDQSDFEARVHSVDGATGAVVLANTGASAYTVQQNAVIYAEWSPDYIMQSPVVATFDGNPVKTLQLGSHTAPSHLAASGTMSVTNFANWGVTPYYPWYRYLTTPVDLRTTAVKDWNASLGVALGKAPTIGTEWDGFRYDPYREHYLGMTQDVLDLPVGSGLRANQGIDLHLTRRVPPHQPQSGDGEYRTRTEFALSDDGGTWYVETNATPGYQAGVEPVLDNRNPNINRNDPQYQGKVLFGDRLYLDVNVDGRYDAPEPFSDRNGNGVYDNGEVFADRNGNMTYDAGDPLVVAGVFDTRIFMDANGNRQWDPGESLYNYFDYSAKPDPDYASLHADNWPEYFATTLGVSASADTQLSTKVVELGRSSGASPTRTPAEEPILRNRGNVTLTRGGLSVYSDLYTSASPTAVWNNTLMRTGASAVKYQTDTVSLRPWEEVQHYPYGGTDILNEFPLYKSPAGEERHFGVALSLPYQIGYRQPTGTYTGSLVVTADDNADAFTVKAGMASLRVGERRLAQVVESAGTLPEFDNAYEDARVAATTGWTNYLTGVESWPAAVVLPGMPNTNRDDLAVFVASNTPLIAADVRERPANTPVGDIFGPDLWPNGEPYVDANGNQQYDTGESYTDINGNGRRDAETDTVIWFRRAKHLVASPSNIVDNGDGTYTVTVSGNFVDQIRATGTHTSDLVVLRPRPQLGEVDTSIWYGQAQSINVAADTVTVRALSSWNWTLTASETTVEVTAHPWVPVLPQSDIETLRALLADPADAAHAGPAPVRCDQLSATMDHQTGKTWLVWTVSAARRLTVKGQVQYRPVSMLAYKEVDQANPQANRLYWMAPPDTPVAEGGYSPLEVREKPVLLPRVQNRTIIMYEGLKSGTTGLYYANTHTDYSDIKRLALITQAVANSTTIRVNNTDAMAIGMNVYIDGWGPVTILAVDPAARTITVDIPVTVAGGTQIWPLWTPDIALDVINWSFSSAGRPQVFADSINGMPPNNWENVNLVFQAKDAISGNTDLYYARLNAGNALKSLTCQSLVLPESNQTTRLLTETLAPNTENTLFTSRHRAWGNGDVDPLDNLPKLWVKINHGENYHPVLIDDTKTEYEVTIVQNDQQYRLRIDPYRGVIRVSRGNVTSLIIRGMPRVQRLTTNAAADVNPMVSVERWRYVRDNGTADYGQNDYLATTPRLWLYWSRRHEDGLGTRAYYRTFRLHNIGTTAAPVVTGLDAEVRDEHTPFNLNDPELNVNMPERMLPIEVLSQDGASLFVTRMSASVNSPEAGLWVLSTASRNREWLYPGQEGTSSQPRQRPTLHDLFLQVINVPVPDNAPVP
jgi:outer membrane protein assembly factor BamB